LQHPGDRDPDEPAGVLFLFPAIVASSIYPENSAFSDNSYATIYIRGFKKTSHFSEKAVTVLATTGCKVTIIAMKTAGGVRLLFSTAKRILP
jgi:hypothetical protein